MNSLIKITVLTLVSFALSSAGDIYTLEECLKIAKEQNATLKSAKLNREMSEALESSAFPAYFPKVYAGAFAFAANDYLLKEKVDLSKEVNGIGQQIAPTMMQMGMDPSMLAGIPTSYSMGLLDKGIVGHLTLIQPVFMGGQIHNGNKLAKIGTEAGKLQEIMSENEIRKNTETFYWMIVALKEKRKTLDEADKQIEGILSDVKTAVEAGIAVQNDLLRVSLEQKKLKSNRLKLENGISTAKSMLARQMNRDDIEFDLAEVNFENIAPPADFKVNTDEAVERRAESKLLAISRKVAQKEREMERGKALPSAAVGASLLYQNVTSEKGFNGVIFAGLSVPISDWWSNSYSTKNLDLKIQKASLDEQENKNLMKVDIDAKWNSLTEAFDQIQIAKESIIQTEENLRVQKDFYSAGTSTITNLLEAETLYQQAKDSYTEAVTGYYTALSAYMVATGR